MLTVISVTLAFALGIIWGLYVANELLLVLIFLFFAMLIILINSKFNNISKNFTGIILIFIIFLFGLAYSTYIVKKYENKYAERRHTFNGNNCIYKYNK